MVLVIRNSALPHGGSEATTGLGGYHSRMTMAHSWYTGRRMCVRGTWFLPKPCVWCWPWATTCPARAQEAEVLPAHQDRPPWASSILRSHCSFCFIRATCHFLSLHAVPLLVFQCLWEGGSAYRGMASTVTVCVFSQGN